MDGVLLVEGPNVVVASVLVLAVGRALTNKFPILSRNNIPLAVTGGLLCSVLVALLYATLDVQVEFDMQLRDLLLLTFFSTIGLSAKFSALLAGGRTLVILLAFAIVLLVLQNTAGVLVALALGVKPGYGLFGGSISFAGGHGTAIAWGSVAESVGLEGAANLGIACATFGLVAGGLLGGPVGGYLVKKYGLRAAADHTLAYEVAEEGVDHAQRDEPELPLEGAFSTLLLLGLCVGVGHNVNDWLSGVGLSLPPFLTAMFVGIVLTNLTDLLRIEFHPDSINRAGELSLHLFLAMSLMSVQLWQIASAIGPLLLVLILQMLLITCIAVFLVFRFIGRDYDASVIASGFLGLGLGATPVAMANMQALTSHFGPSPKAFIVVPLVGAFFMDISNAVVIKTFVALPLILEGLHLPVD